tara:strand:- start:701 stop:1486 length:786 start_codon:yes stop_codon:yes gene_type:complete
MKNLQLYKNQIDEVKNLVEKLDQGELTRDELSKLEELTRAIHERSIILKYKAFENNLESTIEDIEEEVSIPEVIVESIEEQDEVEAFDWKPTSETAEEKEEDIFSFEPIIDEVKQDDELGYIDSILGDVIEEQLKEVKIDEEAIKEEILFENSTIPVEKNNSNETFMEQMNISDQSLNTLMSGSKIDTLIGAFGLNEKLRFINDLFDGSSEKFSDAIKILDTQSDLEALNSQMNELASTHEWDPEEESVAEFISFVSRRYA